MPRPETIINLDPIDTKKKKGWFGRLLVTRWHKGEKVIKMDQFGHYMFCGPQGSAKTSSALWYCERLFKRYKRKKISYFDNETGKFIKFKTPPKVKLYSNIDIGIHIDRDDIFKTVDEFDPYANEVRLVYIDEIQSYFPRGARDKKTVELMENLVALFSQLRKRNTYIISTAQVYGRLEKSLREQCLFMIACRVNLNRKIVNDFIPGDDIICDELGRWSGDPKFIHVHGLPETRYDTKKIIRV